MRTDLGRARIRIIFTSSNGGRHEFAKNRGNFDRRRFAGRRGSGGGTERRRERLGIRFQRYGILQFRQHGTVRLVGVGFDHRLVFRSGNDDGLRYRFLVRHWERDGFERQLGLPGAQRPHATKERIERRGRGIEQQRRYLVHRLGLDGQLVDRFRHEQLGQHGLRSRQLDGQRLFGNRGRQQLDGQWVFRNGVRQQLDR